MFCLYKVNVSTIRLFNIFECGYHYNQNDLPIYISGVIIQYNHLRASHKVLSCAGGRVRCLFHKIGLRRFRQLMELTNLHPTHITISVPFCSKRPLNRYHEASLCLVCWLTVISSPSYCALLVQKHSLHSVISCVEMPCESYVLEWVFILTEPLFAHVLYRMIPV
jgi:hypothetical protein